MTLDWVIGFESLILSDLFWIKAIKSPTYREDSCTLGDRRITQTLAQSHSSKHRNNGKCQEQALPYSRLRSPFLHSNSRRAPFGLTFQFQMLLHLSALSRDRVVTCVRSGRRPRQLDNCNSHAAETLYILQANA